MSSFKVKVLSSLNCYLLQVDESTILLDCGWNENLDVDELGELKSVVKQIDTVLISHGDISHMGAYAYAVKMGLDCPCYGTTPTHDLGGTMLSDIIKSQRENQDFQLFTAADVDSAMSKWQILRYSQPFSLQDKCQGIVITAFGAGHSIGGTLWRIKKDSENVIYSIDYNLRKERHLNGSVLVTNDSLSKPSLLITDAQNTLYPIPPARKERDKSLISTIKDTLQSQGNVLIPVDSTTRVLELIYLLDQQWAFDKIPHHLVFLSHESIKTVNFARSMLEWMGDGISQAFAARELPFDLKNLKILTSMAEFDSLKGPKVVLASSPGLMFGFSRELFIQWSSDPKNTIILPDKGYGNSLSRKLYEMWDEKSPKETQVREPVPIELDQEIEWGVRVPLDGEELIAFQEEESKRNVLEDAARQKTVDSDSDMSDAEEDVEEAEFSQSFDIFLKAQKIKDADAGFFKQQQAFKMFPIYEVRHKIDDYGELIDLADFKKFETKPLQQVEMEIDEPKLEAPKEKPCKYIQQNLSVQSRCKVHYIDFEGRSDSKTVKNIIEHVLPKRLIFVGGTKDGNDAMASYCKEKKFVDEIYVPTVGDCVNVSSTVSLFQVLLTDSLVSSIQLANLDEYKLGLVRGVIRNQEVEGLGARLMLDLQPFEDQKYVAPVRIGDVKLSELKKQLGAQGYDTKFLAGGVLVVNDSIVIQKTEDGRLTVQGQVDEDYYNVRKIIYSFQAVL